jgi:putative glutamine amidotransferase
MTRPLIGITSEMAAAGWGDRVREAVLLPASYALALQRAGCVPVLLPPAPHGAAGLAARLDALLFSDGADIDPRRGGGELVDGAAEPDLVRDAGEFALMRAAIAARLPVLAIGRGMRVLNAVRGGSVTGRPLPAGDGAARPAPDGAARSTPDGAARSTPDGAAQPAARDLRITPGTRLDRVLGPSFSVAAAAWPSGRHQDVDRLGGGLSAAARTADDAVAAVELTGHPFAIGLVWHAEQGDDLRIFEALRDAAAARHQEAA